MKKMIYLLVFFLLVMAPIGQAMTEKNWEVTFHAQIKQWITELSSNDQFMEWKNATYTVEALGPNSKQWMVTLLQQGETIGYMIIGSDLDNQLYLQEYGLGEMSLFDPRILDTYYPDLMKLAKTITKVYHGLESYFLVETNKESVVIDAKTGEVIPEEFTKNRKMQPSPFSTDKTKQLKQSFLKPLSNVEEAFPLSVIVGKPTVLQSLEEIKENEVYLHKKVWDNHIRLLLSVNGYHTWDNGTVFIALNQEGYRFVPLENKNKTDGIPSVSHEDVIISNAVGAVDKPLLLTSLPH